MSHFPQCVVDAGEQMAEYLRRCAVFAGYGLSKPEPHGAVRLHGKQGELLGIAPTYSAVRFPWHGRYEYDLVPPTSVRLA